MKNIIIKSDNKPISILDALKDYPNSNVICLDEQSTINKTLSKTLEYFDNFTCDFAYYQDSNNIRLNTLYVKNSHKMKLFLSTWIKKSFQSVIKNYHLKTKLLPLEYCYIEGIDKNIIPVITHKFVSRETNNVLVQPHINQIGNKKIVGSCKIIIGN